MDWPFKGEVISLKVLESLLLLACFASPHVVSAQSKVKSANSPEFAITRQLALPMRFEVNRGQARSAVDFVASAANYGISLRAGRATLRLSHGADSNDLRGQDAAEFSIDLLGANLSPASEPDEKLAGYSNYLFGSDPSKWITQVAQYAKVRYTNIYPGVDVIYYGNQDRLEHDFVVHPGANPGQIHLALLGAQRKKLNEEGDLVLQLPGGEAKLRRPRVYQQMGTRRIEVAAEYVLRDGQARFRLGPYDRTRTLVIDPVLVYSTFVGGSFATEGSTQQSANGLALDGSGNLYVAGFTSSLSFPVTPGVVGQTSPPLGAAFVSKINPAGTSLVYSTYIGGLLGGTRLGLAVDASGNVYLAGDSTTGLPIPPGSTPFQATAANGTHVAIIKLNSAATTVLYATYLGGSAEDDFGGLGIDTAGNAYISGRTTSNDFPTQNPLQGSLGNGSGNAFVSKLNPTGTGLVYSTYLGESSSVDARGIALDASNNVYVVGSATAGFPTTSGAFQQTTPGSCSTCSNAFLAKLNPSGGSLLYATYLGGSDNPGSGATGVAVDASGNALLTGLAGSSDFPVVNPIQPCATSGTFVSEFDTTGALAFSTCLGLTNGLFTPVMALDASGNVYVSSTSDRSLPLVNPIDANVPTSALRPFVSEINPAMHKVLFSSFIAGVATSDVIYAVAVDLTGNVYAAGTSQVSTFVEENLNDLFPIFNGLQPRFGTIGPCFVHSAVGCTYGDAIIMKISPSAGAAAAVAPSQLTFFTPQQVSTTSASQVVNVYDLGTDSLTVSNATVTGDFAIQNGCAAVAPSGGSCTIKVTFTPTATGTRNGTLTISDSSPGSPHTVALSGEGAVPSAMISPSVLTFPAQPVGTTSAARTVTITSTGLIALEITRVQTSGPFSETNDCGPSLNDGNTCTISATFSPTSPNNATGTLQITDNAADSPQTIALSGTGGGAALGLGVPPGSSNTATVRAGASATYTLSVGGTGMGGTASLSCAGAPLGATCSVPPSVSISATSASTFNVHVSTTLRATALLLQGGFIFATWLSVAVIGWISLPRRGCRRSASHGWLHLLPLIVLSVLFCSCGGGGSGSGNKADGTPAGSYTLVVTAQSGSVTQSTNLTLTVQ